MSRAAAAKHSCAGLTGMKLSWRMERNQGSGGKGTKVTDIGGEK